MAIKWNYMELHGRVVDQLTVQIDYGIIEHFSQHVYSNQYKAIEELIINGYDAGATWVNVLKSPEIIQDHLVIWDNGHSMDSAGLKEI